LGGAWGEKGKPAAGLVAAGGNGAKVSEEGLKNKEEKGVTETGGGGETQPARPSKTPAH